MEISDCFAGGRGPGGSWEGLKAALGVRRVGSASTPNPMGHHERSRVKVFTIRSPARRGARGGGREGRFAWTRVSEASPGTPKPSEVTGNFKPNPTRRPPDLQISRPLPPLGPQALEEPPRTERSEPESETQSLKTPTTCVRGAPPRAARPAPAAPVGHTEEAIACSVGAPRAPGAAGRIRSGHAGQTRRQLQPLRLANLQHLPPLAGSGFAPRAGGGLGAGPPSAGSARALAEPEARIPL